MSSPASARHKPKIAVSACLLGAEVRFNGGHKESRLCSQALTQHFEFVPLCPEVAIGLGIPRQPVRLVGNPLQPQAVGTVDSTLDVTRPLHDYGVEMAAAHTDICGYIFMQKSPSCGLERVKVYQDSGRPAELSGRGIYARAFCDAQPDLPVEEDGRLNDPVLRENFMTRVYAYSAWQALLKQGVTRRSLTEFHARYKYLLMAHHPVQYKTLGNLLGSLGKQDPMGIAPQYFSELMKALKKCATRRTHTNVLQHISGYLKQAISAEDKQEVQQLIGQYLHGIVPLVVPLTLLKHHFRLHPHPYISRQVYLQPHPEDLSLRNAI
ncbi:YbgA family protein [Pseudomonas sp. TWR1-1-3]|uniref:YbgA family protein n=1 Tax=Pseudomonas sp. TWR1-1-3 TaxID=2804624 RepID=UPI003CF2995D